MDRRHRATQADGKAPAITKVRFLGLAFFWPALFGLTATTVAGLAAPWIPQAEIFNHFRPFWLAGAVATLALAMISRAPAAGPIAAAVLLIANVALAVAPTLWSADGSGRRDLRIVTFNLWVGNPAPAAVAAYLKSTDADVLLLQEVDPRLEMAMTTLLAETYPHIASCAARNCGLMLLSKTPWIRSDSSDRSGAAPSLIWAQFPNVTVTGVHLAYPFQPLFQMNHVDYLTRRFANAAGAQVIAGDFNLTPYSWKLNRLSAGAGLLRHATLGASWPANQLVPVVLLDNLLASSSVRSSGITLGPRGLGSDHRPAIFDLSFD